MQRILQDIWTGLTSAPWLDQANLVLGVIGVWLMIRRNLWAFPIGLVAVTVQGILFWQYRFYADSLLQVFFFVLLAYGWWHWTHPQAGQRELPVTAQPWRWRGLALASTLVCWLALGGLNDAYTDAQMPFRDAFIATFSVLGQLLQARKKVENWIVWLAVNAVAVWSYYAAGMFYTSFLYAIYLILAIGGLRSWSKVRT